MISPFQDVSNIKKTCSTPLLVGGDWNHGIWWLSIQLGITNHPNWRTPSFFRGVGIPPTSYRLMAFPPRDLSKHRVEGPYGNRGPVSSAGPWRAHESSSSAESGWGWWFVAGLRTRPLGPLGPLGLCRRFPRASEDGKWCRKKSDNFGATFCSDFFFRRNQMGYRSPLICGTDAERWGFKLLDFGVIRWEKWVDETSKLVVETVETARTATSRKKCTGENLKLRGSQIKWTWHYCKSSHVLLNPNDLTSQHLMMGLMSFHLHRKKHMGLRTFTAIVYPDDPGYVWFMIWLVVWNMNWWLSHILGMSSSQLTNSIIFQRGRYTTNQWYLDMTKAASGLQDVAPPKKTP